MTHPSVPESQTPCRASPPTWPVLAGLMLAVLLWGVYLATGSYLHGRGRSDLRAATIVAATLAFLGLWGAMLWWRQRRVAHKERQSSDRPIVAHGRQPRDALP